MMYPTVRGYYVETRELITELGRHWFEPKKFLPKDLEGRKRELEAKGFEFCPWLSEFDTYTYSKNTEQGDLMFVTLEYCEEEVWEDE